MPLIFQIAIGVALGIFVAYLVWRGIKEKREDDKIDAKLEKMRQLGYISGRAGRPPDFYKEELGHLVDVADEIAIMQGWDRGSEEFKARHKTGS